MALNNSSSFTEVEFLKNEITELNKQYYTALKRIKGLIEENTELKSILISKDSFLMELKERMVALNKRMENETTPDLPESEKSSLSTQTKGYPSVAWVKAQLRGH